MFFPSGSMYAPSMTFSPADVGQAGVVNVTELLGEDLFPALSWATTEYVSVVEDCTRLVSEKVVRVAPIAVLTLSLRLMMYALSPDPPTLSVEAPHETSTCPQLAAVA